MTTGSWLDEPLKRSVDARTLKGLEQLGLATVRDLLWHFPRRYIDLGDLTPLTDLTIGEQVTFVGLVVKTSLFTAKRTGTQIYKVTVDDGATQHDITFFNPRKLIHTLHEGTRAVFSCEVGEFNRKPQLTHPDFFPLGSRDEAEEFARSPYPVYPLTKGLKNHVVVNAVRIFLDVLPELPDPIPHDVRSRRGVLGLVPALRAIHRPREDADWQQARRRFRFEEALVLQVALAQRRAADRLVTATPRRPMAGGLLESFDAQLPFELTGGQRQVAAQIAEDMARDCPDAAAPAGRGRLGQDRRRAARHALRGRRRRAGSSARAHRGARRSAPPVHRGASSVRWPRRACSVAPTTRPRSCSSPARSPRPLGARPCWTSSAATPGSSSAPTRCCRTRWRSTTSVSWSSTSNTGSGSSSGTPCARRARWRRTSS